MGRVTLAAEVDSERAGRRGLNSIWSANNILQSTNTLRTKNIGSSSVGTFGKDGGLSSLRVNGE